MVSHYALCAQDFWGKDDEWAFKLPQLYYAYEEAGDPFELQATSRVPGTRFSVPLVLHPQPTQRDSIAQGTIFLVKYSNILEKFINSD